MKIKKNIKSLGMIFVRILRLNITVLFCVLVVFKLYWNWFNVFSIHVYIYVLLNLKGLIFNLAICFLRKRSVEATPHGNICSITCCVWDSNIHHHRDHPHADGKHSIQPYNPATIVDPPPYTPKDSNQNENTYFGRFRGYLRNKFSNR